LSKDRTGSPLALKSKTLKDILNHKPQHFALFEVGFEQAFEEVVGGGVGGHSLWLQCFNLPNNQPVQAGPSQTDAQL
jgi:hypothetical protein